MFQIDDCQSSLLYTDRSPIRLYCITWYIFLNYGIYTSVSVHNKKPNIVDVSADRRWVLDEVLQL